MRRIGFITALLAFCVLPAAATDTPKFPENGKIIRIIVPFAAGGGVDSAARLIAERMRVRLNVSVIVENKAGASGSLGGKFVQLAPADGYTLLFSAATHVFAKQVFAKPPYDPLTDFEPVARVGEAPLMLVVGPKLTANKLSELVAEGKQRKAVAAIPASGAPSHLATLLFAKQSNIDLDYVPYKGTQPAMIDVAGGHVDLLLDSIISLAPFAKGGKVRAIAVTSKKRSPLAPDVPTVQEAGVANYSYVSWYGIWAPKGTPTDRVEALNGAINASVEELAKSGAFANLGIDPVVETPQQFQKYVAAEVAQGAELLKNAGFKPE